MQQDHATSLCPELLMQPATPSERRHSFLRTQPGVLHGALEDLVVFITLQLILPLFFCGDLLPHLIGGLHLIDRSRSAAR